MFEIGNSLREARLRRHIDLVVAEDDTKIRSKYLAAMETEDFDVLPGPVYTRGFLRTYSRYLGLEPQMYIDEYNSRFGRFEDVEEASIRRPDLPPTPRFGAFSLRNVAIVSMLVIAGLAWLGLRAGDEAELAAKRDVPSGSQPVKPVTFPDRRDPAPTVTPTASADRAAAAAAAARQRLTVAAKGGSTWLEVRTGSATGAVVFSGTLASGQSKSFPGKRLHVTVGYPAAATLKSGTRRLAPTGSSAASFVVTPTAITPA